MLLTFYPVQSNAATTDESVTTTVFAPKPKESSEAKALLLRLDEIKGIDKSNMKFSEKRVLRKEVRTIKHRLNELNDGVHLTVGAAIIIILLLIILL